MVLVKRAERHMVRLRLTPKRSRKQEAVEGFRTRQRERE